MTKKRNLIIAGAAVIAVAVAGLVLPKMWGDKEQLIAETPPAVTASFFASLTRNRWRAPGSWRRRRKSPMTTPRRI